MSDTNWIQEVLLECESVETPRSWLYWSLLCAISAAAGNNYYLMGFKGKVIYKPNIYVILLGESGLGKGFPVDLCKTLVQKAEVTRVIAGCSSIQGVVQELSSALTREKKSPIMDSRGLIINGELSTAILRDPVSLTTLTDLYDGQYNLDWTKMLKSGKEKLKEPYITALFGSSPAHFYESIPQVNIEGGYIGRNLIVFEEKRYQDLDLLSETNDCVGFPFDKFIGHLEAIGSNKGRFTPTPGARDLFNIWRRDWRSKQPRDVTGFINRVPDHVLKTAMCLCLADYGSNNLMITEIHIVEAIEQVTQLVYSSMRATAGRGIDPLSQQTKMILDFLTTTPNNALTRKQLLSRGYGNYDTTVLDNIISNLLEIGWITRERIIAGKNSDWIIKLAGEQLEQYKKFLDRGKEKVKWIKT